MIPIAREMLAQMQPNRHGNLTMRCDDGAASVTAGEAVLLYGLVRATRPNVVLELGAAYGFSTVHLATACRDNGGGFVYSVEPHDWRRTLATAWLRKGKLEGWARIEKDLTAQEGKIDFAFIDAEHTQEAVSGYLLALLPRLAMGATIAIHDACWADHVRRALRVCGLQDWPVVMFSQTSQNGLAIIKVPE